ncbi:MAG: 50S ribosomal protein L30 [Candidatus Bathyarchaeia archaeon]
MTSTVPTCLAVVRIRGLVNVRRDMKETMNMLHLARPNNATLIPSIPQTLGMLQLAKDHITWGEVNKDTLTRMLEDRAESANGEKLDSEKIQSLGFTSASELASALLQDSVRLTRLKGISPVFRLHPPRKGFKRSVKRGFSEGGETGYRGEQINALLERMF